MRTRSVLFWMTATFLTGAAQVERGAAWPRLAGRRRGGDCASELPGLPDPFPLDLAFSRRRDFRRLREGGDQPGRRSISRTAFSRPASVATTCPRSRRACRPSWPGLGSISPISPAARPSPWGRTARPASRRLGRRTGRSSAYYSDEGGVPPRVDLRVLRAKGAVGGAGHADQGPSLQTIVMPPTWSPDGRQLARPRPAGGRGLMPIPGPPGMPTGRKSRASDSGRTSSSWPRAAPSRPRPPRSHRGRSATMSHVAGPDGHRHPGRHVARRAPGEAARPVGAGVRPLFSLRPLPRVRLPLPAGTDAAGRGCR